MKKPFNHRTIYTGRLLLLSTLLTLLLTALEAQESKPLSWRVLPTGVTEDLYDVCCIDTSTVFVCGHNVILKSTDGGESWEEKHRRPGCKMTKMCFANPQVGYAFCDSVISHYSHTWSLLRTDDGGETWHKTGEPRTTEYYYSAAWIYVPLYFYSYVPTEMALKGTDTVFVAISYDGVYRSRDGGALFERTTMEDYVPSEVRGFYLENNTGYLLWGNTDYTSTGIAKTEDGGETWHRINTVSDMASTMVFAHFQNSDSIRVFGIFPDDPYGFFTIIDTQDGFETIEPSYMGGLSQYLLTYSFNTELQSYKKCCFTDNFYGMVFFVVRDNTNKWDIACTGDNGASWTYYPHDDPLYNRLLFDVDGVDTLFFVSGENGLVAKSQTIALLNAREEDIPSVKVYPNPAIDRLFIECGEESDVTVFSLTGEVLLERKLVSESIDTSEFAPGLYLIRVTDGQGKSVTRKVVVAR